MQRLVPVGFGVLVIAIALSGCVIIASNDSNEQPKTRKPSPTSVSPNLDSASIIDLEKSIYQQVNQYRQSRNLPPLTLNTTISKQAKVHSQDMASGKVPFSHQGFEGRVKAIAKSINYRSAAENLAFNQGYSAPASQAVEGWLKSPGHFKNIVGNFDLTGVGVVKNAEGEYYFTQIFIKTR